MAPSERGKNSYQEPTPALARSTTTMRDSETLVRPAIGRTSIAAFSFSLLITARRVSTGRPVSARVFAAAWTRRRSADGLPLSVPAAASSPAPIVNISSTSIPAGILMAALCSQDAQSSA